MKAAPSPYGFRPTACEIRRGDRLIYKPASIDSWYEFHGLDKPTYHVRFSVPEKDALRVCQDIYEDGPPIDVLWEKSLGLGVRETLVVEMDNVELEMNYEYGERWLVVNLWTVDRW